MSRLHGLSLVAAVVCLGAQSGLLGCADTGADGRHAVSSALVSSPRVSGELELDDVLVPMLGMYPDHVDVARGTDAYLVVWDASVGDVDGGENVYGARVSFAGELLDTIAIPINRDEGTQTEPQVAFDGTQWLVAWEDVRIDGTSDVYATRITTAGEVLDPDGIALGTSPGDESLADVASDGTRFFVTMALEGVHGVFVDADGVVDPQPVSILGTAGGGGRVAYNGTHYLVLYYEDGAGATRVFHTTRVTPTGEMDTSVQNLLSSSSSSTIGDLAVASGGGAWLVSFIVSNGVWTAPIAADGTPVAAPAQAGVYTDATHLGLSYGGGEYVLLFNHSSGTQGTQALRVSAGGVELENVMLWPSAEWWDVADLAIAFDGTDHFVAHARRSADASLRQVTATRLTTALEQVDDPTIAVGQTANSQTAADVAFNGTHYLVAWQDNREGRTVYTEIHGSLLSASGSVSTPGGFPIAQAPGHQRPPAVASNGTDFLVAWRDNRTGSGALMFTGVRPDGTLVHPTGHFIDDTHLGLDPPAIASTGHDYLVVWNDSTHVAGALVDAAESPTVTPTTPADLSFGVNGANPDAASNGTSYLVVYDYEGDIYAVVVDAEGKRVTENAATMVSAVTSTWEEQPAVASNGTDYLVVWQSTSANIYGARVNGDGSVRDVVPFDIHALPTGQQYPQVGWDGASYVVTWRDVATWSVQAIGVDVSGEVPAVQAEPVTVSADTGHPTGPQVAGGDPTADHGQSLIVYHRYDRDPDVLGYRVRGRLLGDNVASGGAGGAGGHDAGHPGARGGAGVGATGGGPSGSGRAGAGNGGDESAGNAAGRGGDEGTGGGAGGGDDPDTTTGAGRGGDEGTGGGAGGGGDPDTTAGAGRGGEGTGNGSASGGENAGNGTGSGGDDRGGANTSGTAGSNDSVAGGSGNDGGCGCRTPTRAPRPSAAWLLALAAALLPVRRVTAWRCGPPGVNRQNGRKLDQSDRA